MHPTRTMPVPAPPTERSAMPESTPAAAGCRAARTVAAVALLCTLAASLPARAGRVLESYAHVREDATLEVSGRVIRLHGIHVPDTGRTCNGTFQPPRCSSRAALALDFKIQGFVRCETHARYRDRSLSATCHVDGEDLGAYLISQGWAVAAPGAPFDYVVRERIARNRGLGVWGFHVDAITRGGAGGASGR